MAAGVVIIFILVCLLTSGFRMLISNQRQHRCVQNHDASNPLLALSIIIIDRGSPPSRKSNRAILQQGPLIISQITNTAQIKRLYRLISNTYQTTINHYFSYARDPFYIFNSM
ncbi:MAG: hypothetical protein ACKVJE_10695 [Pseudomonadales bacterium]|jgi:hypothetical protein